MIFLGCRRDLNFQIYKRRLAAVASTYHGWRIIPSKKRIAQIWMGPKCSDCNPPPSTLGPGQRSSHLRGHRSEHRGAGGWAIFANGGPHRQHQSPKIDLYPRGERIRQLTNKRGILFHQQGVCSSGMPPWQRYVPI